MDPTNDLMVFSSPPIAPTEPLEKPSLSPGSNPFDTLLKVANDSSYKQTSNNNILDVAFIDGNTFLFTQTFPSDVRNSLAPNSYEDDYGRESLGILHIDFNNEKDNDEVFLKDTLTIQSPRKSTYQSFLKSISSKSSQSSLPSTIYSIQNSCNYTDSVLANVAMTPTTIEKDLQLIDAVIASPRRVNSVSYFKEDHLERFRRRIASGPAMFCKKTTDLDNQSKKSSLFGENGNNSMEDLMFIEISHTAAKIANGSILEETPDSNMLDSTPAPNFNEILDEITTEVNEKYHTETVFKMIDKMLPEKSNSSNGLDNLKTNNSQYSAKDAIQSLAEILKSENLNEKRKTEGENLLKSLAGILCNSKEISSNVNESTQSSIDRDCFEVLDLRKKSNSDSEQTEALDLSVGTKKLTVTPNCQRRASVSLKEMNKVTVGHNEMIRRASESSLQSLSKEFTRSISIQSNQTGSSNASGTSVLNGPTLGKLKFKKTSATKSGPVKAIIGLANKITTSPKIAPQTNKYKKTSTPVNKSNIKPIAQSTPEECKANDFYEKRIEYPVSPLSRPVSRQNPTESDQNEKLIRSNSTSNVKNKTTSKLMSMQRSFSSGKGIGLKKPTETDKFKNNACKALDRNRSLNSRPFSLLSKLHKGPGKENTPY